MSFKMNENTVMLFPVKNKKDAKSPSMSGKVNVDGKIFDITVWTKTSQKDVKFLSGVVKPEEDQQPASQGGDDDDLPF